MGTLQHRVSLQGIGSSNLQANSLLRSDENSKHHWLELPAEFESVFHNFTPRERNIMFLIYKGMTSKGISNKLNISENTLKHKLGDTYDKSGLSSRLELVLWMQTRMSAELKEQILSDSKITGSDKSKLTQREQTVFHSVLQGNKAADLALEFDISFNTLKKHITAILRKTGHKNRVFLVLAEDRSKEKAV
jgi:DNA-binding NarL/FixJ family response regulator